MATPSVTHDHAAMARFVTIIDIAMSLLQGTGPRLPVNTMPTI
jgi:hypothetical protein